MLSRSTLDYAIKKASLLIFFTRKYSYCYVEHCPSPATKFQIEHFWDFSRISINLSHSTPSNIALCDPLPIYKIGIISQDAAQMLSDALLHHSSTTRIWSLWNGSWRHSPTQSSTKTCFLTPPLHV